MWLLYWKILCKILEGIIVRSTMDKLELLTSFSGTSKERGTSMSFLDNRVLLDCFVDCLSFISFGSNFYAKAITLEWALLWFSLFQGIRVAAAIETPPVINLFFLSLLKRNKRCYFVHLPHAHVLSQAQGLFCSVGFAHRLLKDKNFREPPLHFICISLY